MPTWESAQYLKFADERMRPARDLLARVPIESPKDVADLGCGPATSTELLYERWPLARIAGVDSSPQMLESARKKFPSREWIGADVARWGQPESLDVVFSNATLHWIPDHAQAFPRLLKMVRAGGAFAAQMPGRRPIPARQVMEETAREFLPPSFFERQNGALKVGSLDFYYDVLAPHSAWVDVWETVYVHQLENAAAIVEWFRGSGMRPYLDALKDDEERGRFTARCQAGMERLYPSHAGGRVLLEFPRTFMVALR